MIDKKWVEEFLDSYNKKLSVTAPKIGAMFPYATYDGKYENEPFHWNDIAWWTNGFWGGILWQMYTYSKNKDYKKIAKTCEKKLDKAFSDFTGLHHDVGFMFLPTACADYKITGDKKSYARAIHAANVLMARFNLNGKYIRAWNGKGYEGWAIIDCMMNLPILYWAWQETGDERYKAIAMAHSDTVIKNFIREDGSSAHIVSFDQKTGKKIEEITGQGYLPDSAWSRGQSWAIYGFIIGYIYTKEKKFLKTAKNCADYIIENLDDTYIPVIDYKSPKTPIYRDTTAGAITACGLIELYKITKEKKYLDIAIKMVEALKKECDFSLKTESILQNGSERYHETSTMNMSIIYGDYYLIQALLKLKEIL